MQSITKTKESIIVKRTSKTIIRGKSRKPIAEKKQTAIRKIKPIIKALIFSPLLIT